PDAAVAQFEIDRRALQEIGGDREGLLPQALAGMMKCRRHGHRAAAGEGAGPARDPGCIGERNDHVVGSDLPGVGNDLGEDRFHPLALRGGAGGKTDLARRIDPHSRPFERPDPGALDIAADAEPEISALSARLALTPTERRDAADRIERLLQAAWVIAAVVDDRLP